MTDAERLAAKPSADLRKTAADVQRVANDTQSYAYHFYDCADGSRVEIRAAAVPRIEAAELPDPAGEAIPGSFARQGSGALEGALAKTPEGLFRLVPNEQISDFHARIDAELAVADGDVAERLAADRDAHVIVGHSHSWVPVDAKTRSFHENLTPGEPEFFPESV